MSKDGPVQRGVAYRLGARDDESTETLASGMFGILLTATALTAFEAGFIFWVVIPQVKSSIERSVDAARPKVIEHLGGADQIDSLVDVATRSLRGSAPEVASIGALGGSKLSSRLGIFDKGSEYEFKSIFDKGSSKDEILQSKDRAAQDGRAISAVLRDREAKLVRKANMGTVYAMLIIVLVLLFATTRAYGWAARKNSEASGIPQRKVAMYTAALTISVLIAFQIYFYFVTQTYSFPGANGNEELVETVMDPSDVVPGVLSAPQWPCGAETEAEAEAETETEPCPQATSYT